MRIRLWYSDEMPHFRDEAKMADAPHSLVFDGDVDVRGHSDPHAIAEVCFDVFNRHDSPSQHEALDRLEIRSLSVGDIVEIVADVDAGRSGAFLICASFGFEPVESFGRNEVRA